MLRSGEYDLTDRRYKHHKRLAMNAFQLSQPQTHSLNTQMRYTNHLARIRERGREREREGEFATEGEGQGWQWLVSNLLQVCKSMTALFRAIENCGVRSLSVLRVSDTFATSSLFWGALGRFKGWEAMSSSRLWKMRILFSTLGVVKRDECPGQQELWSPK